MEDWHGHTVGCHFLLVRKIDGREHPVFVRFQVPLFRHDELVDKEGKPHKIRDDVKAARERQTWRALFHYIKAQITAIDYGLVSFEDTFLAHIVAERGGRTFGDIFKGQLAEGKFALPESVD